MIAVKSGPELIDVTRLAHLSKRSILLVGPTGVGKSEIASQAANELGIQFLVRDLSLMEAPDLSGLPIIESGKMRYAIPSFLPTDANSRGIICFEELNRAHRSVQGPCFQLLTAGTLNDYILPAGWTAIACINPQEDGYDVAELDKALMARFMVVRVVPDVTTWIKWAEANRVHPAVCGFVRATPKIFDAPKSNPRAWFYASEVLKRYEAGPFLKSSLLPGLAGFVGDTLAHAFLKAYAAGTVGKLPTTEGILHSYKRHRGQIQKWKSDGNTSLFDSICKQLLLYLQDPSNQEAVRGDPAKLQNLFDFHTDIPAEFRAMFERQLRWMKGGQK